MGNIDDCFTSLLFLTFRVFQNKFLLCLKVVVEDRQSKENHLYLYMYLSMKFLLKYYNKIFKLKVKTELYKIIKTFFQNNCTERNRLKRNE